MWIRLKDSGQEIGIPDNKARYFIANGDAIEIPEPVIPRTMVMPTTPPARRLALEPFYDEALKMVHFSGLPINATEIVMRLLALEEHHKHFEKWIDERITFISRRGLDLEKTLKEKK